jgi:putative aminopeptidase FrvX
VKNRSELLEYWMREILTLPTAPFHEEAIGARIRTFARDRELKLKGDRAGNLVVEYRRGKERPPIAFTSHMDHPGFEVVSVRGNRARLRLLGGVDEPTLTDARILLYSESGPVRGRVQSVQMAADRRKSHTHLQLDNLCRRGRRAHVYGVFTAAEEVGFVGAMELVKGRLLPKKVPLVVLETSRELPGFKIGKGPVIRVGDRLSVYDHHLTRWLTDTAEAVAQKDPDFRFQRALMPGGMCEATLFQLDGRGACALALALANYHNMGPRGATAERVNRQDTEQLLQLLMALSATEPTLKSADKLREKLEKQHHRYAHRLRK